MFLYLFDCLLVYSFSLLLLLHETINGSVFHTTAFLLLSFFSALRFLCRQIFWFFRFSFSGAGLAYSHRETTSRKRAQTSKGHRRHRGVIGAASHLLAETSSSTLLSSAFRVNTICWWWTESLRSCMIQDSLLSFKHALWELDSTKYLLQTGMT